MPKTHTNLLGRGRKPEKVIVDGEKYTATVMRIDEKDQHGRPRKLTLIPDDETVHINEGNQFMIVYAPKKMVDKAN